MGVKIVYKEDQVEQIEQPITIEATAVEVTGDLATAVDSYGVKFDKLKVLEKQVKDLKKEMLEEEGQIITASGEFKAEDTVTFKGEVYRVDLKAKGMKVTHIDKGGILKQVGSQLWFDITVPSTSDLRKYLTPPQIEKYLKEERTGNRSIKASKL